MRNCPCFTCAARLRSAFIACSTLSPMSSRPLLAVAVLSAWSLGAQPAPKVTTPKEALGFNLGDDYSVANYTQLEAYWKKLASESDRMKLVDIGPTAEGRRQYMAIVSSPQNLARVDRYRDIAAVDRNRVSNG